MMYSNYFFEHIKREILTTRGDHMFNKKRKRNPVLFMASMLGVGAAAYYLTKEATQGEDRGSNNQTYPSENPFDYIGKDF
ncbi:hypothetical protein COD11_20335 [Bacillus sp. AFS040349]|nr:hypothetical protein COD11_20335 [Bacillus sp. AFS040349]